MDDIVSALQFVAHKEGVTGTFNAGYGGSITILDLAERIIRITGSNSTVEFGAERIGDVRHSTASVIRLKELGYQPAGTFGSGLEKMFTWMKSEVSSGSKLTPTITSLSH